MSNSPDDVYPFTLQVSGPTILFVNTALAIVRLSVPSKIGLIYKRMQKPEFSVNNIRNLW